MWFLGVSSSYPWKIIVVHCLRTFATPPFGIHDPHKGVILGMTGDIAAGQLLYVVMFPPNTDWAALPKFLFEPRPPPRDRTGVRIEKNSNGRPIV